MSRLVLKGSRACIRRLRHAVGSVVSLLVTPGTSDPYYPGTVLPRVRRTLHSWLTSVTYRILAANLTNLGLRVGYLPSKLNQSERNDLVD